MKDNIIKYIMVIIFLSPVIMLIVDHDKLKKLNSDTVAGIEKIVFERLKNHNEKMEQILNKYKIPFIEHDREICDCTVQSIKDIKEEIRAANQYEKEMKANLAFQLILIAVNSELKEHMLSLIE